jgi:Serine dehydratase beta chain
MKSLEIAFFGALGATDKRAHGRCKAIMLGRKGAAPEGVDPEKILQRSTRASER